MTFLFVLKFAIVSIKQTSVACKDLSVSFPQMSPKGEWWFSQDPWKSLILSIRKYTMKTVRLVNYTSRMSVMISLVFDYNNLIVKIH